MMTFETETPHGQAPECPACGCLLRHHFIQGTTVAAMYFANEPGVYTLLCHGCRCEVRQSTAEVVGYEACPGSCGECGTECAGDVEVIVAADVSTWTVIRLPSGVAA